MKKLLVLTAFLMLPAISVCRSNDRAQKEVDAFIDEMIEMVVFAAHQHQPLSAFESEIHSMRRSSVAKRLRKQIAMANEGSEEAEEALADFIDRLEEKLEDSEMLMRRFDIADEDIMDDLLHDGDFDVEDILEEIGLDASDLYGPCGK